MATVLIAEDEENVRRYVRTVLEGEGHTVYEAPDGQRALEEIARNNPDILLLDMKMPKLDGLGVLRKLAADDDSMPRVVLLTGATDEEDFLRGWGAGADDYISKPFEPETLLGAIERVLTLSQEELEANRQREIERARLLRQIDRFLE